jgi:hypothetical protein
MTPDDLADSGENARKQFRRPLLYPVDLRALMTKTAHIQIAARRPGEQRVTYFAFPAPFG